MEYLESLTDKVKSGNLTAIDIKIFESELFSDFTLSQDNGAIRIGVGEAASPGAATGRIALSEGDVEKCITDKDYRGEVILIKQETDAKDVPSIKKANGLITVKGGFSSHAAIITRGFGIPCVTGCQDLRVVPDGVFIEGRRFDAGEYISFKNGKIYDGRFDVKPGIIRPLIDGNEAIVESYKNFLATLGNFVVKSNSDDPLSARTARILGAKGVGVVRTEHMFFDTPEQERLQYMLEMLMANNSEERKSTLKNLYPMQVNDFENIFKEVKPYQVTIRLLDPPLHEFMPKSRKDLESLAAKLKISVEETLERKKALEQTDPMMGIRGVRLAVLYPEIYEMQVKAIFEAAKSQSVVPEIMIPSVSDPGELRYVAEEIIYPLAKEFDIEYSLACMIETPRATEAAIARKLAKISNAFSFGTNDLTQYIFGLSRDLAGYLERAEELGIMPSEIFKTIDREGVGSLIIKATEVARLSNPNIKIGVCGEHGGDPDSIEFLINEAGVDYVSCSPFRVPVALLSAAYSIISKPLFK